MVIYEGLSFFLAVPYVAVMTITQQQICHRSFQRGGGISLPTSVPGKKHRFFFSNINPNRLLTILFHG